MVMVHASSSYEWILHYLNNSILPAPSQVISGFQFDNISEYKIFYSSWFIYRSGFHISLIICGLFNDTLSNSDYILVAWNNWKVLNKELELPEGTLGGGGCQSSSAEI
jgi:hypothetical protein